jgi:hypothetical protein
MNISKRLLVDLITDSIAFIELEIGCRQPEEPFVLELELALKFRKELLKEVKKAKTISFKQTNKQNKRK